MILLYFTLSTIMISFTSSQLAGQFIAKMTNISNKRNEEITNSQFKSCKDNPMIDLLIKDFSSNLKNSLYDLPLNTSSAELDSCNKTEVTCCSQSTLSLYEDYIKMIVLPNKQNIHLLNTNYYSLILDEHLRNFENFQLEGFTSESFQVLFREYITKKNQLNSLVNDILKDSILNSWNSFCNFICHPPNITKHYCRIYNNTLKVNEKPYVYKTYQCDSSFNSFLNLNNTLNQFNSIIKSMNSSLNSTYSSISDKVKKYFNESDMKDSIIKYNNMTKQQLVTNSLNDGLYVSQSISQSPICNSYENGCESFIKCLPYYCMDDLYLQFYNNSTIYLKESLIVSNYSVIELYEGNNTYINYNKDIRIVNIIKSISINNTLIGVSLNIILGLILILF